MTTNQVETYANRGNIATGDINIKVLLRRQIIPQFYEDVGKVNWRRKSYPFNTAANTKVYAMPPDFSDCQGVFLPNTDQSLFYIGEDVDRMAKAEANVTNAKPDGYYIVQNTASPNAWQSVSFQAPADAIYAMRTVYYAMAVFADDIADVNLAQYIPETLQWALVEGIRREIYFDRFGQGDPRFVASNQAYQDWVAKAAGRRELGNRNLAKFAR